MQRSTRLDTRDSGQPTTTLNPGIVSAGICSAALILAVAFLPGENAVQENQLFVSVAQYASENVARRSPPSNAVLELFSPVASPPPVTANDRVEEALSKRVPKTVADLIAIESRVTEITERVTPATVFVSVGGTLGSGVIVSEDGLVLTAGHVTGKPGLRARLRLADGTRVNGETLGVHTKYDIGILQITGKGPYPFVKICPEKEYSSGDWCLALGHPGGYQRGRLPVVRLGRIVTLDRELLRTDCPLIGGDSGGPLFDLQGRVIAIHSRIQPDITYNFHVPGERFQEFWTDLVSGVMLPPVIGINGDDHTRGCVVLKVVHDYPAERAGIAENDIIRKVDGRRVRGFDSLLDILSDKRVGEEVTIEILRGDESFRKTLVLARRPDEQPEGRP